MDKSNLKLDSKFNNFSNVTKTCIISMKHKNEIPSNVAKYSKQIIEELQTNKMTYSKEIKDLTLYSMSPCLMFIGLNDKHSNKYIKKII